MSLTLGHSVARRRRAFDLALLRDADVRAWRHARQRDDGAAPATINRGLSALRSYGGWAVANGLLTEDPTTEIGDVPLPPVGVDALLRAARTQKNPLQRLRDEALLALLTYDAGLRAQEVCGVQLRDVDLAGAS